MRTWAGSYGGGLGLISIYIGLGLCKDLGEETNRHESGEKDGVDGCRACDGIVESFGGGECAGESYG